MVSHSSSGLEPVATREPTRGATTSGQPISVPERSSVPLEVGSAPFLAQHFLVAPKAGSSTSALLTLTQMRSTLSPRWHALPATALSASTLTLLPRGMWAKRDVCIGYTPARKSDFAFGPAARERYHDRKMILVQAERSPVGVRPTPPLGSSPQSSASQSSTGQSSTDHVSSGLSSEEPPPRLLWPLRWPRHYEDGSPLPFSLGDTPNLARTPEPRPRSKPWDCA